MSSILLAAASVESEGLPLCRVRVLTSEAAAESAPQSVVKDVESWVDAPQRGSRLVSSIDAADVLLELSGYQTRTVEDGIPAQELWFVARRLAEPIRERATHRFIYLTTPNPTATAHLARELPTVLRDVCFGWLPKTGSGTPEGR
jgi:hypothetical protein